MRKAFTLIELMIVIAIIAIIAAIAIPNLMEARKKSTRVQAGDTATVNASGVRVIATEVISYHLVRCLLDNGPGAVPRYSDATFNQNQLTKVVLVEAGQ